MLVRELLCLAASHVHEASNYGPARPCHNLNSCRACCKLRYLEGKFNDKQRNAQLVRVKYHMPGRGVSGFVWFCLGLCWRPAWVAVALFAAEVEINYYIYIYI